jgi:hypothetical protein
MGATIHAQTFETGGLFGVQYEMKILKGWHWNAESQLRFDHNFTHYDRWKISVGTDYTFWKKRIKVGASYSLLNYQDDEGIFDWRHRLTGALTLAYKASSWKIAYRAAFQWTFRDEKRGSYRFNPKSYMRNRVTFSHSIPQKPLKVYVAEEFWWRLYHPEKNIIDHLRTTLGVEYNINKHHTLDFHVRSDNEVQVNNPTHILYIGVKYSFD